MVPEITVTLGIWVPNIDPKGSGGLLRPHRNKKHGCGPGKAGEGGLAPSIAGKLAMCLRPYAKKKKKVVCEKSKPHPCYLLSIVCTRMDR